MKRLIQLIIVSVLCSSCGIHYREFSATGQPTLDLRMPANVGILTSKVSESNSRSGGIPLLGGAYANDMLTEAKESTGAGNTGMTVGQFSIRGTIDNSTSMDVVGQWTWRSIRSIATALVFWKGIDTYGAVQNAKTSADVSNVNSNNGVKINDSNNAAAVSTSKIDSDTVLGLEALKQ